MVVMSNNMSFVDKMKEQIHKRCGKPREKKQQKPLVEGWDAQIHNQTPGSFFSAPLQQVIINGDLRSPISVFFLNEGQTKQRSKKSIWSDRE